MADYNRKTIISALVAKPVTQKCPTCLTESPWLVPGKADNPDQAEMMMTVSPDSITTGFVFVPMICSNCGYTRLIHHETLMKDRPE